MKVFTLLKNSLIAFLFILPHPFECLSSVSTDYFRTYQSGDYTDISTWESSSDNVVWELATIVPSISAKSVTIRSGHVVTAVSRVNVDDFVILDGGTLVINSSVDFNIYNGAATVDGNIMGTIVNWGILNVLGAVFFQDTGVYQHVLNGANKPIPSATWEDGSSCEVIGITSFNGTVSNTNQNFYNFVWNCPNQINSSNPNINFTNCTVRNNLLFLTTGSGGVVLSGNSFDVNINNYIQYGGAITINPINNSNIISNLNISGDFIITGGVIRKGSGDSKGYVIFNGTAEQIFSKTGGTISGPIEFIVNSNAIVNLGESIIEGTGTFTLNNGATLITAHPQGISSSGATGAIQNTGTRTYSTQANYVYNGTSAQQTGNGLPATINNLTIDNLAGVTLRNGSLTVSGELNINNGSLDLGTNALVSNGVLGSTGTGTLFTQNTSATPITADKNWGGTVAYNSASAQTIVAGNYTSLSANGGLRTIAGNVNISGDFTPGTPSSYTTTGSTINFNGSGAQNIPALNYHNLTVSTGGTKTVTGEANIINTVNVQDDVTLNANGYLTLLATATSNANIAPLSGSADITGNVNVQSFVKGSGNGGVRGTRTMSSPINDALTSGAKTFEQLKSHMIVTGAGGTSNGFDAVPSGVSNANIIFTYNNSLASPFVPLANITTPLTSGGGFIYFFMGNRDNKDSNPGKLRPPFLPAEDVTLTYTGIINKGNIDIPINYNSSKSSMQGAFVAGNPYPSTIDWEGVYGSSTNIGSSITIVVGGQPNATYNAALGQGTNGGSRYIQPGQGFYVYAGNGGGTLSFRETHKNTVEEPARLLVALERPGLLSANGKVSVGKSVSLASSPKTIRMQLENGDLKEEALVALGAGFDAVSDQDDSPYITGYDLNLATLSSDNKLLAINLMPEATYETEVKLAVNSKVSANLKLNFTDIPQIEENHLLLKDNYLGTETLITPSNSTYEFAIDKNTASTYGNERFALAFTPGTVLPVTFTEFKVAKQSFGAELRWTTVSEINNERFEIERSADGLLFETIGKVQATGTVSSGKSYYFTDKAPVQGNNYYRIKQVDTNGDFDYSEVKSLDFSDWIATGRGNKLILYPNPVEKELTIDFSADADLELSIIDMIGRKQQTIIFTQNERIKFNTENLAQGNYIAELRTKETGELLGYGKFIKR